MAKKQKTKVGWHFIPTNKLLEYGDGRKVKVGETLRIEGRVKVCNRGLHASEKLSDACYFKKGPVVCRVTVSSPKGLSFESLAGDYPTKFAGHSRKVHWMYRITQKDVDALARALGEYVASSRFRIGYRTGIEQRLCDLRNRYDDLGRRLANFDKQLFKILKAKGCPTRVSR